MNERIPSAKLKIVAKAPFVPPDVLLNLKAEIGAHKIHELYKKRGREGS